MSEKKKNLFSKIFTSSGCNCGQVIVEEKEEKTEETKKEEK